MDCQECRSRRSGVVLWTASLLVKLSREARLAPPGLRLVASTWRDCGREKLGVLASTEDMSVHSRIEFLGLPQSSLSSSWQSNWRPGVGPSDGFVWVSASAFVSTGSEGAGSTSVAVAGRSSMRSLEGASSLYTGKLVLLWASTEYSASNPTPESYLPFSTRISGRGFLEVESESILDEFEAARRGFSRCVLFRRRA